MDPNERSPAHSRQPHAWKETLTSRARSMKHNPGIPLPFFPALPIPIPPPRPLSRKPLPHLRHHHPANPRPVSKQGLDCRRRYGRRVQVRRAFRDVEHVELGLGGREGGWEKDLQEGGRGEKRGLVTGLGNFRGGEGEGDGRTDLPAHFHGRDGQHRLSQIFQPTATIGKCLKLSPIVLVLFPIRSVASSIFVPVPLSFPL